MNRYYENSGMKVVEMLGSNLHRGLLEYDCTLRREEFGNNKIKLINKKHYKIAIKESLNKWITLTNIAIFIILILTKQYLLLTIAVYMFLINIGYKLYIKIKNNNRIDRLQKLNTSKVIILREGVERLVEAHEIVRGDIVILKKGSFIAADLRVISSSGLKINDKNITGDSNIKEKNSSILDFKPLSLGQISNMIFRGSIVVEGEGVAVVVETGESTQLARFLASLRLAKMKKYSLIKEVDSILVKSNTILMIVALLIYMILPGSGQIKNNVFANTLFITTTILFPIIAAVFYKRIANELATEGIFISNLSTLGDSRDIKVVFLDKLGSITKNKFEFKKIYSDGKYIDRENFTVKDINIKRILDILYVNSNAFEEIRTNGIDSIDDAYVKCCEGLGYLKERVRLYNKMHFRVPRESEKRLCTTVIKNKKGFRANVRGNLDEVLNKCTYILVNGVEKPLTTAEIDKIKLSDLVFSRDGLITEGIAYRSFAYEPSDGENVESNLVFVGLVALENILIDAISEDIKDCFDNGILPIVFCEDNKIAGEILGRKIGLVGSADQVVSGAELTFVDDAQFYKLVSKGRVFCRLSPGQRIRIIDAFYKDGFNIATEGENLVQLTTLVKAKVGIVKGKASELLKSITGTYSNVGAIETILTMKNIQNRIEKSLEVTTIIYIQFLLAQICTMFLYYFIKGGVLFSPLTMVVLNCVTLTPVVLITLGKNKSIERKNRLLISVCYVAIALLATSLFKSSVEFMVSLILTVNIFITIILTCKFKFSIKDKDFVALLIAVLIVSVSLYGIYVYTNALITNSVINKSAILILIYIVMIFVIKRWQD